MHSRRFFSYRHTCHQGPARYPLLHTQGGAGFTLVELLVVIAIVGFITAVILLRYGSYDSEVLLGSLAYDVALSVREAQTLSISVRGGGDGFEAGYGMHFVPGNQYVLFRDVDDDSRYDASEAISTFSIGQDNTISDLCANSLCGRTSMDIVFRRPEPDAIIAVEPSVSGIEEAEIVVRTPTGLMRTVVVSVTGQISVE